MRRSKLRVCTLFFFTSKPQFPYLLRETVIVPTSLYYSKDKSSYLMRNPLKTTWHIINTNVQCMVVANDNNNSNLLMYLLK